MWWYFFTGTSDENGEIEVYLPPDDYVYRELDQPTGFIRDKEDHKITVLPDGTIEGDVILVNEEIEIRILKCDAAGKPLQGSVFGLFVKDELKMSAVADKNGIVMFSQVPFKNQEVEIREIKALDGFQLSGETIVLKLDDSYENPPKPYS